MAVVRLHIGKQIEADGEFEVAGVEIYQVICPSWRNMVQQLFGKVAVRVNEGDTVSLHDMLHKHIAEQCCFARSGFADDIYMVAMVGSRNAKRPGVTPAFPLADHNGCIRIHGSKTSRHSSHRRKSGLW